MNQRNNYLIVPISFLIVGIVTTILAICKLGWYYYLVGALVGVMNHALLVRQTFKIERYAKLDPEGQTLKPKSVALIGLGVRFILFIAVFLVLIVKADVQTDKTNIWLIVTALLGYLTVKVVSIVVLLICSRRKVDE